MIATIVGRKPWRRGEEILIDLPMKEQLVKASPFVEELTGQAAVTLGPLVYCFESLDNPQLSLFDVCLNSKGSIEEKHEELFPGYRKITTLLIPGKKIGGTLEFGG